MSLINKMLQDLDKRHAADGGSKTLTQQLRPVQARRDWRRISWEVGAGLIVGAGWAAWVLYQISPHSVVTDLVFAQQAKRPRQLAAAPEIQVVPAAPLPAQPPTVQPEAATPEPTPAAARPADAIGVDMLKLATVIATPIENKPGTAQIGSKPKPALQGASTPKPVQKEKNVQAAASPPSPATEQTQASIDKRIHQAAPAERAEIEFQKASRLLNQGRVAEAIDGYKSSLQQDPGHAAARQALVGLLLENRRIDEAQQFLQAGLSLNSNRSDYAMLLARIQVERGDLQGAHELLRKHAGSAAGDADYHAFDAALLQRLGRHKEAIVGYQEALKLAPREGRWWMGMAISLQADNRGAEALEAYRRAKTAGGLSPPLIAFVDQRVKQLQ